MQRFKSKVMKYIVTPYNNPMYLGRN